MGADLNGYVGRSREGIERIRRRVVNFVMANGFALVLKHLFSSDSKTSG